MFALGLTLLYIRAIMTNIFFDAFGSIFVLLLVATSFLFAAFLDWVCAVGMGLHHFRELRRYLLVSIILAAGGFIFLLDPNASIRLLCYFTAAYALLLGIGKLRLAQYWHCGKQKKIVINLLGAIAICFSGMLVGIANADVRRTITVLALYSMFVGAQMLLSGFYLYSQRAASTGKLAGQQQAHA
jgi:hypothetical protein